MSKSVLPTFASGTFIVSSFPFWCLFKFIFVYGATECFNFTLLQVAAQCSQHHLLKRLSFSIVYSCLLCQRLGDHRFMGLFLGFLLIWIIGYQLVSETSLMVVWRNPHTLAHNTHWKLSTSITLQHPILVYFKKSLDSSVVRHLKFFFLVFFTIFTPNELIYSISINLFFLIQVTIA